MAFTDYDLENELALQKMKEAQALRKSELAAPTIKAGGQDIINFLGPINRFMEQTQGNRMEDQSIARQRELAQQQQGEVDTYNKAISTPGTKSLVQEGPTVDGGNIPTQQIPMSPEEENQRQMALSLDASRLPNARKAAAQFIQSGVGFPEKMAQIKAQQDLAREQQAGAREDRRLQREQTATYQAGNQAIQQGMLDARNREIDNKAGNGGLTPAQQKRQDALDKKEEGKTGMSETADAIDGLLTGLDKEGGVTSTKAGGLSNAMASLRGSTVGQMAGQVFGTESQEKRDQIKSLRLQLLNDIKNATGMSSQQLNSNMELQTWLKSLGDPGSSVQAQKQILNNIRGRYLDRRSAAPVGSTAKITPTAAHLAALKANPQMADQFKAKFGYLPEE